MKEGNTSPDVNRERKNFWFEEAFDVWSCEQYSDRSLIQNEVPRASTCSTAMFLRPMEILSSP